MEKVEGYLAASVEVAMHTSDDDDDMVLLIIETGLELPTVAKLSRYEVDNLVHNLKHCQRYVSPPRGLFGWFWCRWRALVDRRLEF